MCKPDFYGIKYEINPWMKVSNPANPKKAMAQWSALKAALENAGVRINLISHDKRFPDMVFTANGGLVSGHTIVLSNFKYPERKGEKRIFMDYFLSLGYQTESLPHGFFEGEGDALFCGSELVCGYGFRSNELGAALTGNLVDKEPVLLELKDPHFYHLDTCFCYPKEDLILCYLSAFDHIDQLKIERLGEIIPVSRYDAENFVCNGVPVGNKLITTPMSKYLRSSLEKHGIEPVEIELSEFLKSGGAAKCLTLFI